MCLVYLDDIFIYSHNTEQHFKCLHEVLEQLKAAELKFKLGKCYLFQKSIIILATSSLNMAWRLMPAIRKYNVSKSGQFNLH